MAFTRASRSNATIVADDPPSYGTIDPFPSRHRPSGSMPLLSSDLESQPLRKPIASSPSAIRFTYTFITYTLPKEIYLYFLFRFPSFYHSRVSRIFEDLDRLSTRIEDVETADPEGSVMSSNISSFRNAWEELINSLLNEWKMLSVISALLVCATSPLLFVTFWTSDPIIITSVAISLLCSIFSLLYGYLYSIRLSTMRTVDKAIRWSYEAQRSRANFVWNVWVLLAMPAVSFVWSVVFLIAGIMSLVWRGRRHTRISDDEALTIKVIITSLLAIAVFYLAAMMRMFNRFGSQMEWGWQRNVRESLYVAPGNAKDTNRPTTTVPSDGSSAGPSRSTVEVAGLRTSDIVRLEGVGHAVQRTTGMLNRFWTERACIEAEYDSQLASLNNFNFEHSEHSGHLGEALQHMATQCLTIANAHKDLASYIRNKVIADTSSLFLKQVRDLHNPAHQMAEERIEALKTLVWSYANAVSDAAVTVDKAAEDLRVKLEKIMDEEEVSPFDDTRKERVRSVVETSRMLMSFWVERVRIEQDYADQLEKLSEMELEGAEEPGNLRDAVEKVRLETRNMAKAHTTLASHLRDNTLRDILALLNEQETNLKTHCHQSMDASAWQKKEQERVEKLTSLIWAYANAFSIACVADDEAAEQIRIALDKVNPKEEIAHTGGKGTGTTMSSSTTSGETSSSAYSLTPPSPQPGPSVQKTSEGEVILFYVKTLYDYQATIPEEFDFKAGDIIAVTKTPDDGWWSGRLVEKSRGQRKEQHIFPSNFVTLA